MNELNTFAEVIVGIDGSENATTALEWAARFAATHHSNLPIG